MAEINLFSYSLQPSSVFISTKSKMTLIVTNPQDKDAVNFTGGPAGDVIAVSFPYGPGDDKLVKDLDFTCNKPQAGFTCKKSASDEYFTIKATKTTSIQPGQTLTFIFDEVPINDEINNASPGVKVTITEIIGGRESEGAVTVSKQANNTMAIFAWANPSIIAVGQVTDLYWQSVGGTYVIVEPFKSGKKRFNVSGVPPYPGTTKVGIPERELKQYIYTLTVSNDEDSKSIVVVITHNEPVITQYSANKAGAIAADDNVDLEWFFLWGESWVISSNTGITLNKPIAPQTVYPGSELQAAYKGNYGNMPSSVYYELAVSGYKTPPDNPLKKRITFEIKRINLLYFKFSKNEDGKLSEIVMRIDQQEWKAYVMEIKAENLAVLTLYQPGKITERYYLGDGDKEHPQIQYFSDTKKEGGTIELNWITANLKNLVLEPGDIKIPADKIKSGNHTVSPAVSTTYTLTGTTDKNEKIVSILDVKVT